MSESPNATWSSKRTIDLFYIKGRLGWKGLRASEFIEEGPFLITGTDFDGSKVDWSRSFHISDARFLESPEIIVQPSDILITKDGTIGKVAFIDHIPFPGKASLNSHLFLVRGRIKRLDQRFAFYVFLSYLFMRYVEAKGAGSTRIGLPQRVFEQFEIPVPPLDQQRRIAEILSTLDETIERTEALIAKYQQIKAGLMHDLFTRGVTPDGKLRPPDESRRTKFGWIPKNWQIGSLLDVTDMNRQAVLTGPFGADLGSNDFIEEGVPILRIGNVQQGWLKLSDLLYVSEAKARQLERYKINDGDLLFARQGATTGRNALASKDVRGWLINYHIIRVALDHSRCAPIFIEAAFAGVNIKRQVERDKGRGTREGVNTAQLKALEIPLAPVDEQRRIARILTTYHAQHAEMENQLTKLRQQKHGLMHDLLTGRVRVKVDA